MIIKVVKSIQINNELNTSPIIFKFHELSEIHNVLLETEELIDVE